MPQSLLPGAPDDLVSVDDDAVVRKLLFIPWVIWGALLFAVFAYVAVGQVVAGTGPAAMAVPPELVYAMGIAALGVAVAAVVLRRKLMPRAASSAVAGVLRRADAEAVAARYFTAHVLTLSALEAIAVLGLVLTIMGHDPRYVDAFGAVAAVAMGLARPSSERLRAALRGAAK